MNPRMVVSVIVLSLALAAANAQTNPPPPTPEKPPAQAPEKPQAPAEKPTAAAQGKALEAAKPAAPAAAEGSTPAAGSGAQHETPPDVKAFQEVLKITDPEKKIAALEKFKTDFPQSMQLGSANSNILTTLAQKMPKQEARIRAAAQTMYDAATRAGKASAAGMIASSLLSAEVLLEEAQKYAEISLLSLDETKFLKDEKAAAERRKAKEVPTDEELRKRFQRMRAPRLATLGRIELALGHSDQGKKLLEESYAIEPDSPVVAGALGELAAKNGEDEKALNYLVTARLAGKAPATSLDALNSVYKKSHGGSLDGFEAMLDAEYHRRFPNPVHLEPYQRGAQRSDRLVLAEVFTGSGCPPCVGADLAFEAAMERYARQDLAVVMYHQHIPQPDPMSNPDTQARNKYYEVKGVPTYAIDGKTIAYNGSDRTGSAGVFDHIREPIEQALETAAEAHVKVEARLTGDTVSVKAAVEGVKEDATDLKVHVLLVEKELRYSGENGIRFHPMVVRAMGGEKDDGFELKPGAPASFEQTWDLAKVSEGLKAHLDDYEAKGHRGTTFTFSEKKYQIDRGNLAVVVLVQNAKTRHVLQTAYAEVSAAPAPTAPAAKTKRTRGSK